MKKKEIMSDNNKDVTLNYIDKVHINLHAIGKKMNRTLVSLFLICLLLLALCFDVVSLSNNITFLGISIEIEVVTLYVVLCVFCYFFQVYLFGLGIKGSENSDLIT